MPGVIIYVGPSPLMIWRALVKAVDTVALAYSRTLNRRAGWGQPRYPAVTPETFERWSLAVTAYGVVVATARDFGSGDWRLTDLAQPQQDYGIWMSTDKVSRCPFLEHAPDD